MEEEEEEKVKSQKPPSFGLSLFSEKILSFSSLGKGKGAFLVQYVHRVILGGLSFGKEWLQVMEHQKTRG